jgi:N-acetylmuramoyl-L-alanine amidase
MSLKINLNYSPNFNTKKRPKKQIKFIIFHYTGMKSEKAAIDRLTNIQSEVGCHYLIKKNGDILNLVPDSYTSWHAGISAWKNFRFLNKNSIGVEITNPGHQFLYKNFSNKQINSVEKLSKYLIKKYNVNKKNILGHSDISPDRKKDPGERFPWKDLAKKNIGIWHNLRQMDLIKFRKIKCNKLLKKRFFNNLTKIGYFMPKKRFNKSSKFFNFVTKAFQRKFRPELIDGKIDIECLLISKNLTKI